MSVFLLLYVFLAVLPASAQSSILDKRISLDLKGAGLKESLRAIERQIGVMFNVQSALLNKATVKVNLSAKDMTVRTALDKVLAPAHLRYRLLEGAVVIDEKPENKEQEPAKAQPRQQGRISGKIFDGRNEPLIGATIRIVGNNNKAALSATDGSYMIPLEPGTYTLEVSFISFQTQRITEVAVKAGENTALTIAMKTSTSTLNQVVVTSGYKKASVAGLYAQQKNSASISNGISAEQIAATPDRNVGESLKRISGVSTADNKFVLVRGIGERYNAATLDGTILPSTEAQKRSFSFDMIPNTIVDNVVVVKTITPDMNMSFGGGAVQINTKDIPTENFISVGIGTSVNDQSIGKDFLSRKRGKQDFLGFDDGRRSFPTDLKTMSGASPKAELVEQTRRFTNDNFTVYKYRAAPAQNYQFTIGQQFALDKTGQRKFGFTGALNYRNSQTIQDIEEIRRGKWNVNTPIVSGGYAYNYNTTLGGILNMGLQLKQHRFSLRNTYTHLFDNAFTRIYGVSSDDNLGGMPDQIRETDDPTFTTLIQNKITGTHQLQQTKVEWDFARTSINRQQKDIGIASQAPKIMGGDTMFFYVPNQLSEPRFTPTSRQHYSNRETHYSWNVSASRPFRFGKFTNTIKAGYFGTQRSSRFDWTILPVVRDNAVFDPSLAYLPVGEWLNPENVRGDGYLLLLDGWGNDYYAGKSQNHAGYLMFDNKLSDKWRLVWGLRAEYYDYKEINNGSNAPKKGANGEFTLPEEKNWQWLPSANLTYSPIHSLNIRAAYSSTVVRPEMMDNSQFFRYSAFYDGLVGSAGISSTRINSWDFKAEWFPGLGEILSIGGYYKYFDKPAEMIAMETLDFGYRYTLKNSNWAKVYGLELEVRKNLGFISKATLLQRLTVYGNMTWQQSKVEGLYMMNDPVTGKINLVPMKQKRALYGQAPYLLNVGLQYQDEKFGWNIVYNKSGRKTYFVTTSPAITEYEQPRQQLDAQVSYKFFKSRLEVRLNAANLLNAASVYYNNRGSYEPNPDNVSGSLDFSNAQRLKEGFTDNYEEGDLYTFKQRFGRTYSATLTYKF
ncbi:TonB-dependent receptor domain-containing protein [Chitinophaga nivalis]|uniref:TonB-dependent receptor n=1 Tax=Chitinophaga nivalis TaxID=2991709 RepID=A0ABT3IQV7_9BACT|nr:TonB-dependent receptor [Chitinophaga nivalis]MCW3463950.1 TonB-dependent receptor [Chitinophaga nivalis]MCW3486360.1 TonB-dependent receptor [Chitinophaga nivalis]